MGDKAKQNTIIIEIQNSHDISSDILSSPNWNFVTDMGDKCLLLHH